MKKDKIEEILRMYDKNEDGGRGYREYYELIYERDYEPNMFEVDEDDNLDTL